MAQTRKMQDKKVLVTGSGTGIGKGIALEFAREGAAVVLHYSHSDKGAKEAVNEIRQHGGRAEAFKANFDKVEEVKDLAKRAIEYLGGLDVLVNNAGITVNLPFEHVSVEQFDLLYHVNVRAQFFLTQAVLATMERGGKGAVINLTSVHAFAGMTEHAIYAGTKGAIMAYTRELSLELIQKGIRVNGIAPGWIRNENQEKVMGESFNWEEAGKSLPAGFVGNPSDVAKLAVYLASEDSRYIIGQTIIIDGGQLAILPLTGDFRKSRTDYQFGQGYVPDLKR